MKSEKRYYSGTAEELLNDPYELRLYMTKMSYMDREHKAEIAELKGDLCSSEDWVAELKKEIKQLKARIEELENPKSVPVGCSCHSVDFYGADAAKIHEQEVKEAIELRGFW